MRKILIILLLSLYSSISLSYNISGHYYSILSVLDKEDKFSPLIAFCAQVPDLSIEYDAVHLVRNLKFWPAIWYFFTRNYDIGDEEAKKNLAEVHSYLHVLTGDKSSIASEAAKQTFKNLYNYYQKVKANPKTTQDITNYACSLGFSLHMLGDSFAHKDISNKSRMYSQIHGHAKDHTHPDDLLSNRRADQLSEWKMYTSIIHEITESKIDINVFYKEVLEFKDSWNKSFFKKEYFLKNRQFGNKKLIEKLNLKLNDNPNLIDFSTYKKSLINKGGIENGGVNKHGLANCKSLFTDDLLSDLSLSSFPPPQCDEVEEIFINEASNNFLKNGAIPYLVPIGRPSVITVLPIKCLIDQKLNETADGCICDDPTLKVDETTKQCVQPDCEKDGLVWDTTLRQCVQSPWLVCLGDQKLNETADECICDDPMLKVDETTKQCVQPDCEKDGLVWDTTLRQCVQSPWLVCLGDQKLNETADECICDDPTLKVDETTKQCVQPDCEKDGLVWDTTLRQCVQSPWLVCLGDQKLNETADECICDDPTLKVDETTKQCVQPDCEKDGLVWDTTLRQCVQSPWLVCLGDQKLNETADECICDDPTLKVDETTKQCVQPDCEKDGLVWDTTLRQCANEKRQDLQPIKFYFRFSKYNLLEPYMPQPSEEDIYELINRYNGSNGGFWIIEGHADERGEADYNKELGCSRASKIKDELSLKLQEPIVFISKGEKEAVKSQCGDSEKCHLEHRIVIVYYGKNIDTDDRCF